MLRRASNHSLLLRSPTILPIPLRLHFTESETVSLHSMTESPIQAIRTFKA
jgi:hypothetical protein